MTENTVKRELYLKQLAKWRDKQVIKVICGVRRCGKSTLLRQYIDQLRASGVSDEQIVAINLEDPEYAALLDCQTLYAYVKKRLDRERRTYIFIDEIQQCANFEKAVNGLFIQNLIDIYITGSNAYMLSGELATLLSGRYIKIDMLPLSFAEYVTLTNAPDTAIRTAFDDYMRYGAFPYVAMLNRDRELIRDYIEGIYSTILLKDVARREHINDIPVLERIIKFLCSAIGSPVSTKKISDTINSSGRRISANTVETYLRTLTESYIFYKVDRYDIQGKQHLKTLGKYYVVDTAIRNHLLTTSTSDLGHLLENIVYLELRRRGGKVSVGKLSENEVDFVVETADERLYYQVAASTLDEKTLERELLPLRKIPDNYPKYLLTLDDYMSDANYEGIRKLHLVEWLRSR